MMTLNEEAMMRTIVDLPEEQIEALKKMSELRKESRAELVRQAVAAFIQQNSHTNESIAFGILRDTPIKEPVAYQQQLRSEWDE